MNTKFELIDLSNNTSNKKEVSRVFDSFKSRVNDYSQSNNAELDAKMVINPPDSELFGIKKLTSNIYLSISDAAYNNSNIEDLINRLRFFKFDEKYITQLLFIISSIEETSSHQNEEKRVDKKRSIEDLYIDSENKKRIKRWLEANKCIKNSSEAICVFGPSGVGKTTCISAIADELSIPYKSIDISELFSNSFSKFEDKIASISVKTLLLFDNFDVLFADLAKKEQIRYEMVAKRNCILKSFGNKNCLIAFTLSSIELMPLDFLTRISLFVKLEYPNIDTRADILSRYCSDKKKVMAIASKLNGYSTREIVTVLDKVKSVANSSDISILSNDIINSIIEDSLGNREVIFSPDGQEYSVTKPSETLERVVIPQKDKETLLTALSSVVNEKLIYDTWGFRSIDPNVRSIINFYGPPGTGKTMCANAIANLLSDYCNKPFELLSLKYSEIESMYVGEAPKKLEKVFNYARNKDIVLFFDEADSFLGKRIQNVSQGAEQAINSLRSTMLIQLEKYHGVVIFATNLSTNYDPAFKTRFLAEIEFKLPDKDLCIEIFKKNIPKNILDLMQDTEDDDWRRLGETAEGISGRDIKTIVWRVLANAARFDGDVHVFVIQDFIDETAKYKEEKYPKKNAQVKPEDLTVKPVSDEDKEKVKNIVSSSENHIES